MRRPRILTLIEDGYDDAWRRQFEGPELDVDLTEETIEHSERFTLKADDVR